MTPEEAGAVYAAALGRVEALRERYGADLGERLVAGLAAGAPAYRLTPGAGRREVERYQR